MPRNGVVNPQSALLQTKVSTANFSQNSDQPWMKHAEAYFLQAEAKLRLGVGNGDVQSLYEEGVRASFSSAGVNSRRRLAILQAQTCPWLHGSILQGGSAR